LYRLSLPAKNYPDKKAKKPPPTASFMRQAEMGSCITTTFSVSDEEKLV